MQDKEVAQYALKCLMEAGADKASCVYSSSEKNELTLENDHINMLRTTFNKNVTLKAIKNQCLGTLSVNKTDSESLAQAVRDTLELAESGQSDTAYDIAPRQPVEQFDHGTAQPDLDAMYHRLREFQQDTNKRYPEVLLELVVMDHTRSRTYTLNSNGTDLQESKGHYYFTAMFTSKKDGQSSSFNYEMICLKDLNTPIINVGQFDTLLRQSTEQTQVKPLKEKFTGDIVITPKALDMLMSSYLGYLGDYYMISGSSVFKDKIGERIAHESLSIASNPIDAAITDKAYVTKNDYVAQNLIIIDRGVLQSYLVSLYAAKKTGLKNPANDGVHLCIEPGDKHLEEMIGSIDKGLLLCRFSGGKPGGNGDFSGVAKNSYYIENGKIQYPVQEVMVSGNLLDGFNSIKNISRQRHDNGYSLIPWIQVAGWTISGS